MLVLCLPRCQDCQRVYTREAATLVVSSSAGVEELWHSESTDQEFLGAEP